MREQIQIGDRIVGPGAPCLIVAEAGVNHNGDACIARDMVDAAWKSGADVVKFQTFKAARLVSAGPAQEMFHRLELSDEAHCVLWAHCRSRNIIFLSAPFDEESADLLDRLGVAAFKIASGELTNLPFLAHVARKGKTIILSTGMATQDEVGTAVETIRSAGNDRLVLLHCVSNYPARPEDANLRVIMELNRTFDVPVGFSDHTPGIEISLAAVALGACVIEKHFTLGKDMAGPDHAFSLDPAELTALVSGIHAVESALGHGRKEPVMSEIAVARASRKSLVAARPLPAGTVLTADCVAVKRPGTGIPPPMITRVLGRRVRRDVAENTLITLDMLD